MKNKFLDLVSGLLPGKKKASGFFMELEEAVEAKIAEVKAEVKKELSNGTKPVEAAAPSAAKVEESPAPKESDVKSAKTAKPKTAKAAKVESAQNGKVAKPEAPIAEPVKATPMASVKPTTPVEATFAPKYLSPGANSNGRRRPGANMSSFLEMARQVKTPNK
ncbi:MAG: hypothetical protein KME60_17995 [Cyanomargarita calcarea GSE-NOS-MK-12-04C]|jgi:hypothetical protein|uniref:Uncharacterized protein n=1 Tax=Cyanomargarita calcarea GSE-NOS-MK-12-04C TaxID=2839659 RepID=A0A951UVV0_9CYAN|nr:hypothetical protein [Cyanomargarita calcarea GSE-NOS-MK-12-04C]